MLTCIPCVRSKRFLKLKGLTQQLQILFLKPVARKRRRSRKKENESSIRSCEAVKSPEDDDYCTDLDGSSPAWDFGEWLADDVAPPPVDDEWVAEHEPGVLLTLYPHTNGCNQLKKIRFSKELFNARDAQIWWNDNFDNIVELYKICEDRCLPPTPYHSENECTNDSAKDILEEIGYSFYTACNVHCSSQTSGSENYHGESSSSATGDAPPAEKSSPASGSGSSSKNCINIVGESPAAQVPGNTSGGEISDEDLGGRAPAGASGGQSAGSEVDKLVVEDQPGVYVFFLPMHDGSKKLWHVALSPAKFSDEKAKTWWKENRGRILKQYHEEAKLQ